MTGFRAGLRFSRKAASFIAALGVAALGFAVAAQAQAFPTKVVRLVVPYPAGGGIDQIARPLAEQLAAKWGQPVIVENKPGAATAIAAEYVARAPADGYTLFIGEVTTFGINPHVNPKLSYDPLKDFAPVTVLCRLSPVIAINAEVPAKTLPELLALAKAQGGKLSYGSFGNGSYAHIGMEELKRRGKVDMLHVPYKGGAAALAGLVSGETKVSMATITNFLGNEQGGKLRIIAATTEKRLERRPELPTVAETLPGYVIDSWVAVVAPAETPATVLDKIRDDIAAIAKDPAYRQKNFTERFLEPIANTRADAAAMIKRDHGRWRDMVQGAGVKVE